MSSSIRATSMPGSMARRSDNASRYASSTLVLLELILFLNPFVVGTNWCDLDTGQQTISDNSGQPHSIYISVTRDGSVWVRVGKDHRDQTWQYHKERNYRFQDQLLNKEMSDMLTRINYSDWCVLSDLRLLLKSEGIWHPSFISAFSPKTKRGRILVFKRNEHCYSETNITLSEDRQSIKCDGGRTNSCGEKNLPQQGKKSQTLFLKTLKFDPQGASSDSCQTYKDNNYYTFLGSYYHAYVKVAKCLKPTDSRKLGYEAKLRMEQDPENQTNIVIIPDPTQSALNTATIRSWQTFVKIISPQHEVYFQVWRPSATFENTFALVGQTHFHPNSLRFQEIPLSRQEMIHIYKGDVLGLYFPNQNPIGWTEVPCAGRQQNFRFLHDPDGIMSSGRSYTFQTAPQTEQAKCRHYSFSAVFANKTNAKLIEDWTCPTAILQSDTRKRSGSHSGSALGHTTETTPGLGSMLGRRRNTVGIIPIHIILIIIGCLLILLMIVGFISYYKAIGS